ncbi:hypothetical protein Hanom_Chr06g00579111 [Helianthus anomalus]
MAPGKDNLYESFSVLTQKQLDKFIREYYISTDLNLQLPACDKPIYPFLSGKFPFYTRVCNFANYRVPFLKFLMKVLRFFWVHLCQYFYESITVGDWYTFAHRKGILSPAGEEKSTNMAWRFKNQSMDFELGENFACNQNMAQDLIDKRSPIRPLPEHILLLGRVDALKVPNFANLDFGFVEVDADEEPFIKQTASAAQEIRPLVDPKASSIIPTGPESGAKVVGSSGVQVTVGPPVVNEDSDPEIQDLDREFKYLSFVGLFIEKGRLKLQINPKDALPFLKTGKKTKKDHSSSTNHVLTDLTEHLAGGKSSREEAAKARSAPTITYSGYLPVDGVEEMETEDAVEDGEDQVSFFPLSWFGHEVMTFFRYADVFSDKMEVDPATTEQKFIPDWDIKNKDPVMDTLTVKMFLLGINTPVGRSGISEEEHGERTSFYKKKLQRTPDTEKKLAQLSQDLSAHKEKIKSLSALNQYSQAVVASASENRDKIAGELTDFVTSRKERDEEHKGVLAKMEESLVQVHNAYDRMITCSTPCFIRLAFALYFFLTCFIERDMHKSGEVDLKAKMEAKKKNQEAEVEDLKLENAGLNKRVEELRVTKV